MGVKICTALVFVLGACTLSVTAQNLRSIPNTISSCYRNSTAYNRYARQPMHIENLIAIVRKIEEKTFNQWTTRQVARTILKQFQFDGLSLDPDKREEFKFETSGLEDHRNLVVYEMIPGEETIPEGALDNDEKCALHWMLSHSINATLRDDERYNNNSYYRPNNYQSGYLRAKREVRSPWNHNDGDDDGIRTLELEQNDNSEGQNPLPHLPRDTEKLEPSALGFERLTNLPTTKKPLETGIVYTKWGPIAAGRVLAGIAAGLEPVEKPIIVSSESAFSGIPTYNGNLNRNQGGQNGAWIPGGQAWGSDRRDNPYQGSGSGSGFRAGRRKKRQSGGGNYLAPLISYHAATLAGDVGQAAILNAVYQNPTQASPPTGQFNDSICPREYIMDSLQNQDHDAFHEHDTWTYMTAAEIRGGVDGIVLGSQMQNWDRMYSYRLSEILDMYYSEKGIVGQPRYRACNRASVFSGTVDGNIILEQAKSFAYLYNNRTSKIKVATADNINYLYNLVQEAYQKMTGFAGSLSSFDAPCERRENSGGSNVPESDKHIQANLNVYVVLDHTDTADPQLIQQKRFAAQLAYELDVNRFGSRLGMVNGATGQILIKPNWTDTAPILACKILSENTFASQQQQLVTTLNTLITEFTRIRNEEIRDNYQDNNGIVVLFLNQGKKYDVNTAEEVQSKLRQLEREFGDVHVMYATSKYQVNDYDKFVVDREWDVIRIQNAQNLSTEAGRFAKEFVKKNHGRLTYTWCNENQRDQDNEDKVGKDIFISPNTIHYYKISPDYFYSARNLRLRFSSYNGRIAVCESRTNRFPNMQSNGTNRVYCEETKGTYQAPGSGTQDQEYRYNKPCGGDGTRDGCRPIYLSITPISGVPSEADRLDCLRDQCQYADQVKVTFSHWDMRCNTAVHTVVSFPGLFITLLMSVVTFYKYS